MLSDRKIAVFIDVDNTEMSLEGYRNVVEQLSAMGEIVCATIYGASERKQKGVIDDAMQRGFSVQPQSRTRKRVRRVFDDRIWVDVTDLVARNSNIDTVAVVAIPTDMVYLFSHLRRLGLLCVGVDNLDEASLALVSDTVKTSSSETSAPAKKPRAKHAKSNPTVADVSPVASEPEKAEKSAEPETSEDDPFAAGNKTDSDGDVPSDSAEKPVAPERQNQSSASQKAAASVAADMDSAQLIDKIQEMYKTDVSENDDELVAEIQKLLSGLD